MNYFDQIWESIYFYEERHGCEPDVIFISSPLFCELANDYRLEYCNDDNRGFHKIFGIVVKQYNSLNLEYYLAEGPYNIYE